MALDRRPIVVTFRFTVGPDVTDEDVASLVADAYAQFEDPAVLDDDENSKRIDLADLAVESHP